MRARDIKRWEYSDGWGGGALVLAHGLGAFGDIPSAFGDRACVPRRDMAGGEATTSKVQRY